MRLSSLKTLASGAVLALVLGAVGCSHAKKTTPELSDMEGKKVALIAIEGEPTARSTVEVALINQLVKRGSFDIVSKQDVEKARVAPEQDPTDWVGIGRRAGADYALKANVLDFTANVNEGYSAVEEEDSQMAEERGEDESKVKRLYKVKSLTGLVRIQLDFASTIPGQADPRSATVEATDEVTSEGKNEAAHLPPRLRFLEKLSNEAIHKFFEEY